MNEREDKEVARDWADKNLKLGDIEQYYEVSSNGNVRSSVGLSFWVQVMTISNRLTLFECLPFLPIKEL